MNGPRSLPYAFRVAALDGWVWLFDNSERTYCCTTTPSVFAEPLYPLEETGWDYPLDSAYFEVSRFCDEGLKGSVSIELDDEYTAPEAEEKDAWDAARDEASANHRL